MVDAPAIFQINKIPILDVVSDVSVSGAPDQRLRVPPRTRCDVLLWPLGTSTIVPDKGSGDDVSSRGLQNWDASSTSEVLAPPHHHRREKRCHRGLDRRPKDDRISRGTRKDFRLCEGRVPYRSPHCGPSDRIRRAVFAENGNGERKEAELRAMDGGRIGNEY